MTISYFSQISFTIFLIIISFLTGFFFSQRELFVSSFLPKYTITQNTGQQYTLFSEIKSKPLYSLVGGIKQEGGQFQYVYDSIQNVTYFSIQIDMQVSKESALSMPDTVTIAFASICCNGLEYEYKNSNFTLSLSRDVSNELRGSFSSSVEGNIEKYTDRVVMTSEEKPNEYRIIKDDEKDWPKNVLEKNAPYFWVNF